MNFLLYYLIILPLSYLPMRVLYLLSDSVYMLIYHLFGYRKKVVRLNLKNSFPEKSKKELKQIEKKFYHHFCDLLVETLKTFTMSESEVRKRFKFINPEVVNAYHSNNQSIVGIIGHYGNWEWAALSLCIFLNHRVMGIFHKIKSEFWDKTMRTSRGRFGLELVGSKEVGSWFEKNKNELVIPGFIADQAPHNAYKCHWMTFLNQETSVYLGAERTARENNWPVLFGKVTRVKRGYYEIEAVMVTEKPREEKPGFITEKHTQLLEQQIKENPEFWLWTHKRWKKKKPADFKLYQG